MPTSQFSAEQIDNKPEEQPATILKSFEPPASQTVSHAASKAFIFVIILIAGIGSGWVVTRLINLKTTGVGELKSSELVAQTGVKVGDVVGVSDEKAFRDSVEGILVEGGIEGEGSHHLEREGGASQNVYLTSSTVDLSLFTGHRVNVWGETFSAQKAGWLMDVGRVKVLELNTQPLLEE